VTSLPADLAASPAVSALRLAVDVGLAILAWLVQLVIYPAFAAVDRARFRAWHAGYTRRISWVVVPLMFAQLGLHGRALWREPAPLGAVQAALIAAAWLATFLVAVPCHGRLQRGGCEPGVLRRLLAANGVRVAVWSAVAALSVVGILRPGS